jgi:hypothetical protein
MCEARPKAFLVIQWPQLRHWAFPYLIFFIVDSFG